MIYKELYLEFNKIRLKIKTNYGNYYDYLRLYFKDIIREDFKDGFHVSIEARWQRDDFKNYMSAVRGSQDVSAISANTLTGKNRIVTVRKIAKKTKILFDFREEREKIYLMTLTRKKPLKDFLRYNVCGKAEEELFFEITYPIIYYSLFWYQECFCDTHMLHASAIETGNKCVVVCGLEGIGKTSLSLALLDKNGYFLSDNLIFYDGKNIFPCYELIRVSKKDDTSLWKDKIKKINEFRTPKDFYRLRFSTEKKIIRPGVFIFPKFSSSFSAKEIDKKEAVNKAIGLSQLPAELNNYNEYANLYSLTRPRLNVWEQRYASLGNLLEGSRSFEIGMNKADGLEKNSERLGEFIKDV